MSGPVKPYPWPTDEHFIAALGGGLAASTLKGYITAAERAFIVSPFIVVGRERRWRIHPDDPWPDAGDGVFSRATIDMWCDWYTEARRCQLRSTDGKGDKASGSASAGDSRARPAGSPATRKRKRSGSSKSSGRRTGKDTTSQRGRPGTVVRMPEFRT